MAGKPRYEGLNSEGELSWFEKELLQELRLHTRLLHLIASQAIRPQIEAKLRSDRERQAYKLSDGEGTTRSIGAAVGVDQKTISNWWARWRGDGIAVAEPNGRTRHLLPVSELAMPTAEKGGSDSSAMIPSGSEEA